MPDQFVMVRMPDNTWIKCKVKQIIPCPYSLLAQIAVKAVHGRPFDGRNYAVVPSNRVNYINQTDEDDKESQS